MFYLVYQSKTNPDLGGLQISEMLEKARKFNKHHKITGCLLFYGEQFFQYIEGEQAIIFELYERIKHDIRHTEATILSIAQIEEREFDTWDMAFENLSDNNCQLEYLKLLISSFIDDADTTFGPNPTSINFWKATKKLLETNRKVSQY